MVTIGGAESVPPPGGKEDILKAVGIRVKNAELINGGHTANFSIVERSIYHRKSFPQVRINSLWHYINNEVAFFEIINLHFLLQSKKTVFYAIMLKNKRIQKIN